MHYQSNSNYLYGRLHCLTPGGGRNAVQQVRQRCVHWKTLEERMCWARWTEECWRTCVPRDFRPVRWKFICGRRREMFMKAGQDCAGPSAGIFHSLGFNLDDDQASRRAGAGREPHSAHTDTNPEITGVSTKYRAKCSCVCPANGRFLRSQSTMPPPQGHHGHTVSTAPQLAFH